MAPGHANAYYRDYVLKFVIIGDASVGKSSLLVRLTDQRFLTNPDATVSTCPSICTRIIAYQVPWGLGKEG